MFKKELWREIHGSTGRKNQLFAKADFSNGEAEHKDQVMLYLSREARRCLSHSMGWELLLRELSEPRSGKRAKC